jgi:kynurenine formamidase
MGTAWYEVSMTWAPHAGDEVGAGALVTPESVAAALALVRSGRVLDLEVGRFPGMPRHPAQPGFDLVTYRSPRGERASGDPPGLGPAENEANFGFVLELMTTSMHLGTHIDALCHVTAGDDSHWYGGFRESEHLGDKGALASDVTHIPPIFARGILLDVASALGFEQLPEGHQIGADDLQRAAALTGVELRGGDVVLVRTGHLRTWPKLRSGPEPGLTLDGAQWIAAHGPVAIGADNAAIEVLPSGVPGHPQPVHVHLMVEAGIYLIEWVWLEGLAEAGAGEFLFVCLPLKVKGATGSLVRPVAVI